MFWESSKNSEEASEAVADWVWRGVDGNQTEGLSVGPWRIWPGQVSCSESSRACAWPQNMSSDPDLAMEASSLEGQVCLQTQQHDKHL